MVLGRRWVFALLAARSCSSSSADETADAFEGVRAAVGDQLASNADLRSGLENQDADAVVDALVAAYSDDTEPMSTIGDSLDANWNYESPRDLVPNKTELSAWFDSQEMRYFTSHVGRTGSRSVQDVSIAYLTVREGAGASGALLLLPGRAEAIRRYDEFLKTVADLGYSPIYIMTHRGQGESDRLMEPHSRQHVDKAEDFVVDMRAFVDLATAEIAASDEDKEKPLFLWCHSLGCAMSTAYLIEEYEHQRPQKFNAHVGTAPAFQPNTSPFPFPVALALGNMLVNLGQGRATAPTTAKTFEEGYNLGNCNSSINNNPKKSFTRCKRRNEMCEDYRYAEVGNDRHTGLCLHGMSSLFVLGGSNLNVEWAFEFRMQEGKKLSLPTLYQLSVNRTHGDGTVMNFRTTEFCETAMTDCNIAEYDLWDHSLHHSADPIRNAVFAEFHAFFQSHRDTVTAQAALPDVLKELGEGCNAHLQCHTRQCDFRLGIGMFGGKCAAQPHNTGFVYLSVAAARSVSWVVLLFCAWFLAAP